MNPVLRQARSSPYIGEQQPEGSNKDNENVHGLMMKLHSAASDERFEKLKEVYDSIHFKTGGGGGGGGSSSSSTDLQFYTDSQQGSAEILQQWAKLIEEGKASNHEAENGSHHNQQQRTNERSMKAESADNLAESHSSRNSSMTGTETSEVAPPEANCLGKHRSETNLPGRAFDHPSGFRLLEKCCSVELNPKMMIPPSRLARSKEMPNIADVEDCEMSYDE